MFSTDCFRNSTVNSASTFPMWFLRSRSHAVCRTCCCIWAKARRQQYC